MPTIDYTQDPKTILIELINTANNISLNPADFVLDEPKPYLDQKHTNLNTAIDIIPTAESGYYGRKTVYYARLDIANILSVPEDGLDFVNKTRLNEIVPQLNTLNGIELTPNDYYDVPLPPIDPVNPSRPRLITILIKPTSLMFHGIYQFNPNPQRPPLVDDAGVERLFHIVHQGLALADVKRTMMCLRSDNTLYTPFIFLGNVTGIAQFELTEVIALPNATFALNGLFTLTYATATETLSIDQAKTLFIDALGLVTVHSDVPRFDRPVDYSLIQHKNVGVSYAIDPLLKLVKFSESGTVVPDFIPAISEVPALVRLGSDGCLYVVSGIYTAPDPYNALPTKQIRIDRLLPSGAYDEDFSTVYMRASAPSYDPLAIFDLFVADDGFVIAFEPKYGVDIGSICPVVNDVPFVPLSYSGNTTASWNPTMVFDSFGLPGGR